MAAATAAAAARPTIAGILSSLPAYTHKTYTLPKTANKGLAGHYLEDLLAIPRSSACLDCVDGEVKVFPLKRTASGGITPKETVAVTMCQPAALLTTAWRDSNAFKKLQNTVFIPYMRDGDDIEYYEPIHFSEASTLMAELEADYKEIQLQAAEGVMTGSIGKYLQTRTKGTGHGSTSRAFYLRPCFLTRIMEMQSAKNKRLQQLLKEMSESEDEEM
jgi:DNA mismatch repair protein MutH